MKIFIGYFDDYTNDKNINENVMKCNPVCVSYVVPEGFNGSTYRTLSPTSVMYEYSEMGHVMEFLYSYNKFLGCVDINEVVVKLMDLSDSEDVLLLLSNDHCSYLQRASLMRWFRSHGFDCEDMVEQAH